MSEIETMLMWDKYDNKYREVIDINEIGLEELKTIIKQYLEKNKIHDILSVLPSNILEDIIENQQKEIEELKKYEEGYKLLSYSLDNYINKDKIKAKIEYYRKIDNTVGVRILENLLEDK